MSPLRVIAGRARGRLLSLPPETTRPTSHKVRAAVFSMLEAQLHRLGDTGWEGLQVLDLFAGSGAYGIEALSRGAAWVDFVEQDRRACRVISDNLRRAGFAERARVHCGDALAYLRRMDIPPVGANLRVRPGQTPGPASTVGANLRVRPGQTHRSAPTAPEALSTYPIQPGALRYDIIIADPPYGYPQLAHVLAELGSRGPGSGTGFIVVETGRSDPLPTDLPGLHLLRQRRHGDTAITLFLWSKDRFWAGNP